MEFIFFLTLLYTILAFFYLWYRYLPIISLPQKVYVPMPCAVSVVVPIYNEPEENLRHCIESIINTEGEKEIILVNDCSTQPHVGVVIVEYANRYPDMVRVLNLTRNSGKRRAQIEAVKRASNPYIVTVDSDSLLDKKALLEITKPFTDINIGAVTGEILVENKVKNALTRILTARYWSAFNFERESLNRLGIVTCCSGPLTCYRKELLLPLLEGYDKESFLGVPCTFGDDRYLTRMILQQGYQTAYNSAAKATTYVPESFKDFLKQQLRWKKSFIRESIMILPFAEKRGGILLFETVYNLILPILGLLARIVLIIYVVYHPMVGVYFLLLMVVTATMRSLLMFERHQYDLIFRNIVYAYLHEFLIFWLFPIAALTLKRNQWGNRGLSQQVVK